MTLLNQPYMAQVNWSDSSVWPMWEQAGANILSTCLQSLAIERQIMHPTLGGETCTILATDPNWDVVPDWTGGALASNVMEGRRVRVLAQSAPGSGVWYPWFFGYIETIEPDPTDIHPARVKVTAQSALAQLATRPVTLPALVDPIVYSPVQGDQSCLTQLLIAAELWHSPLIDLTSAGGGVWLTGTWGGVTTTFGEALAQLCQLSGCVVSGEPLYATASTDMDWQLRWLQPVVAQTADFTWDNTAGDLSAGAQIRFRRQRVQVA